MALLLSLAGCGGRDNAANVGDKEAVVSEAADAGTPEISETLPEETAAPAASTVYFTADISPEGLVKAYEALNWTPTGKRR